ncbi:MAG: M3 family metallopeptidase [Acidimicrobiia bacterium]
MTYDLSRATPESIEAATATAIARADALVDEAVSGTGSSFAERIAPLDRAAGLIQDASGYGPFLTHFHTEKAVRDAGNDASQKLSTWSTDLVARRDVYDAVNAVDIDDLEGLERKSADEWVRDLHRAGHQLAASDREQVQKLRQRLVEIEIEFSTNIAEYEDHLDVPIEDLNGLPDSYIASLEDGEEATKRVTLDYPAYVPFMDQARSRGHREALRFKYQNRSVDLNRPLLEEAIRIRSEIAAILGYRDWAEYAMEPKMADPERVADLYSSIIPGLTDLGLAERQALTELLHEDVEGDLETWDWRYYHTIQQRREYGIDQNEIAEYFPLDLVVQGMLDVTGDVLGLTYTQLEDVPTWHEDVLTYHISDTASGEAIATFHLDLHPRDGKFTHAACWCPVVRSRDEDGTLRLPVAAVAANFTKPSDDAPSLLKHDEAVTLWHEFGHVLHACITEIDVQRFAGYDTEWDFVEAPSQIMENWMWDATVLARFARHYETGEPIPEDMVTALVAARDQNIGLFNLRQVFLGQYDLKMHTAGPAPDLEALHDEAHAYSLLPDQSGTFMAAAFGHLMGGYDAGYYGYMWAHVYGDDMFSVFESEGILSPEVGRRYRSEVLAMGSSRDAWDHLQAFLGREPNADAFLNKMGIS